LVVLDVFERIRPPRLRGGNSYAEDYQAVLPLKALCDRYGIAMLVLHHVTKLPYDDPVDSVSGTLGFVGAADGVLVLRREAGTTATLFMRGRDVEQREIALRWSPEVGSWTTLGEVESHRQSQQRRQILELLREADGPLSPQEIAAMLHHDYGNVRRLLFSLFHAGEVRKAARGQYVLGSGSQLPVIGRQLGRPEDKAIVCD
ncbi:MAG: helix-turn-helix domain-containing protein, partial [Abitibacteriaceae bacterium]|nr:helix-turn-helix domain-containing protein [Abditibacteriaceae bacterium]